MKVKAVTPGRTHFTGMTVEQIEWFYKAKEVLLGEGHYEHRWVADQEMGWDGWWDWWMEGFTPEQAAAEEMTVGQ